MMNCMNCSNIDSEMIASDVNLLQRNSNVRLKDLHNDKKYVANIIDLLIQTLTLEKEKSKDHSWKEVAVKLMHRHRLESEEKYHAIQNMFIMKNVQKLKTSVQLLSKQLQMQKNTCYDSSYASMLIAMLMTIIDCSSLDYKVVSRSTLFRVSFFWVI